MNFTEKLRKSWIEETFFRRECVKFISSSRELHRCVPVCQVCQSLIRCCCGRLIGEHNWEASISPISLNTGPGHEEENWSMELHTKLSNTNAYGTIDFHNSATRVCRAKYARVAVDSNPDLLLQLMLREWQMERPKLLLTVHGGTENFTLPPKVKQAFSKGLITAALSTGAWILTDGINTGVSKYVGEAVKVFGSHNLRKRNTVGLTPWGVIDNSKDLIGTDVFRPYQPLRQPLSKRASLNGFHSHFLLVDDGTLGKYGCQQGFRRKLEKHIQLQKIHPRLNQGVPVVCVVVEGGPNIVSTVLECVSSVPPIPVFVFEGSGRAADLLAFLHKQTAINRQLDADIKDGFLVSIANVLSVEETEASRLYTLLLQCMDHRQSITIFDSESEDQMGPDAAILTSSLKGTNASPAEQLSIALAWDRADVAQKEVLVSGRNWEPCGQTYNFLHYLVEDVKQTSLPVGYRLSLIDMGLVIEYLIGGAYRSTYTRKHFRTAHSRLQHKEQNVSYRKHQEMTITPGLSSAPLLVPFNSNDLFVWAVLQQRQQMALFLWQYDEEALARATVACKLYRSMAFEARQSSMDDNTAERFKAYSLEFGQLAVDVLDCAFRQNEKMAMKLLTSEMEAWSHFTCLQMAVSSGHRPFVSHSCTQTLLTDLWTGALNMRKNSFLKIILSLLLPPAILLLDFKSQAEMCHVPQSHEASLFGRDSQTPGSTKKEINNLGHHRAQRGQSSSESGHSAGPQSITLLMLQSLSWLTRVYEFYTAPVVKFWFHTMSYLAFLMLFSYTVLVKMEDQPSVQESLVIVYILSTAAEKMREVLMSEPRKLSQKLKIWFSEYWNISDFIAILLFLVGLVMRLQADPYRRTGRICYCLDIIFWFVRVLDLLAVNQHAGPYLTMIIKMTSNMFFIVVMMVIVLLSFGLSRKAIMSPDEEPSWSLARDVVFQPYWMIFGEVYAGEIDVCADGQPCPPGFFITPFLQAVYMFVQYIIMVNILIAFFNNIYFDMASKSNKLWKYNRYRYIMTYQERPWLPPPIIMLCHMTLGLRAAYRSIRGGTQQEERGSGLKLYLSNEGRKKLHEFEEKCVQVYFHEKNQGLQSTQTNQMRATAERAEEMCGMVEEVSERVSFIQESVSELDSQLGQLQDLLALTVDALCLLNASDSLQKEAQLAKCQPSTTSRHVVPHSWTFPYREGVEGDRINMRRLTAKLCKSTPPSLLRGYNPSRRTSQECHIGARASRGERQQCPETEEEVKDEERHCAAVRHASGFKALTPYNSGGASFCPSPSRLCDRSLESHHNLWICKPSFYLSQESVSMEEEKEDQEEEERQETHEQLSNLQQSRTTSSTALLFHPKDCSGGLVNPTFFLDDKQLNSQSRPFSKREKTTMPSSRVCLTRDRCYHRYCRSLSSSMENMTMSGAPRSPQRGSFPSLTELQSNDSLSFEWAKSSDFTELNTRERCQKKKTVKIQEKSTVPASLQSHLPDTSWKRHRRFREQPACWSGTSLSQLNLEQTGLLQNQVLTHHDFWAKSLSRRSLLQSNIGTEVKCSPFQSADNLYLHCSAMERNNLMRLAQTILFTPVSILGGEEVSVYCLEEIPQSDGSPSAVSSWSSQGLSALLQPLSSEEGSLDGGLCQGCRVLCTWAEQEVLRPGLVYIVKAFRPEVVCAWQKYFHGSTSLQLCLREIQQQRAAQKLMQVFNQLKPCDLHYSPRFLDVSLILWNSNGQWLTIERNMTGDFRKYNNNTGEEITPCCLLEEMLLAFSHWTYEYSHKELLVLDMQGVGDELTDPTVIMADNQRFKEASRHLREQQQQQQQQRGRANVRERRVRRQRN